MAARFRAAAAAAAPPQDARDAFVVRHQAGVWRYLRYLGADAAQAEEFALEALWRAVRCGVWQRDDAAMAAAWLRTTARRLLVSQRRALRRRDARRLPLDALDSVAVEQAWDELADDGGEGALDALHTCLQALDGRARKALSLRYGDGASRAEMACALGLGESGVKQLLRRVRARLRACVEQRLRDGGGPQ